MYVEQEIGERPRGLDDEILAVLTVTFARRGRRGAVDSTALRVTRDPMHPASKYMYHKVDRSF